MAAHSRLEGGGWAGNLATQVGERADVPPSSAPTTWVSPKVLLVAQDLGAESRGWLQLRLTPEWAEAGLTWVVVPEGDPLEATIRRQAANLDPGQLENHGPCWVLVSPGSQQPLLAGVHPPPWASLQAALEASRGPAPLGRLQRFLQSHPDHWPARRDLLQQYLKHLPKQLALVDPGAGDLSPQVDDAVWGPLSREWEAALRQPDWAVTGHQGFRELPKDLPDKRSPLMRAMYVRQRPQVLSWLEEDPGNLPLWLCLVRMNQVLGSGLWPDLHPSPHLADQNIWIYPLAYHGKTILQLGLEGGDPREAARILGWIWSCHLAPMMTSGDFQRMTTSVGSIPAYQKAAQGQAPGDLERSRIWDNLVSPYLEALLRSGQLAQAQALLGSLTGELAGLATEGRIDQLLETLGKRELRPQLSLGSGRGPTPPPTGPNLQLRPAGMWLVTQHLFDSAPRQQAWSAELGIHDPGLYLWHDALPLDRRSGLGWEQGQPRWAVLSPTGQVILQGDSLPSPGALVDLLRALGFPPGKERLEAYLVDHPGHLPSLAQLTQWTYRQVIATSPSRRASPLPPTGLASARHEEFVQAWGSYLDRILASPLGVQKKWVTFSGLQAWRPAQDGPQASLRQELSRRHLKSLEAILDRRPTDETAWQVWCALRPIPGPSPADLLAGLAPSPLEANPLKWPPSSVLSILGGAMAQDAQWGELADLLHPRWATLVQETRSPAPKNLWKDPGCWTPSLSLHLIRALGWTGRTEEAVRVIEGMEALGMEPPQVLELRKALEETARPRSGTASRGGPR